MMRSYWHASSEVSCSLSQSSTIYSSFLLLHQAKHLEALIKLLKSDTNKVEDVVCSLLCLGVTKYCLIGETYMPRRLVVIGVVRVT